MENWESIQQSRQRAYEARIEKERQAFWHKSITKAAEHFKRHITQQVEQGLEEYSTALRQISIEVSQPGAEDILPDETVMISRLVRGVTRQIQQKYCPTQSVEPGPSRIVTAPPNNDVISIQDDSDPPTPESISAWVLPFANSEVKEEPSSGQPNPPELDQENDSASEHLRENSQMVAPTTPQREISGVAQEQNKRPLESTEPGLSHAARTQSNKRARRDNPKLFSGTLEDEPTELGSIHCSEVEGQDYIFSHDAFPGYFFVIRCDRDSNRSGNGIFFRFPRDPLAYSRAANHFRREKPKERCHEEDVTGDYSEIEIITKFGYRVYGDDLGDEGWVARSNEKADRNVTKSKTPTSPGQARSRPRRNSKGKEKAVDRIISGGQAAGRSTSITSTVAGPSNTTRMARRALELGPARRSRTSVPSEPDVFEQRGSGNRRESTSRQSHSRDVNVAPVADMGVGFSPPMATRRNPSRPGSRTSTGRAAISTENMPDGIPAAISTENMPDGLPAASLAEAENDLSDSAGDRVISDLIDFLDE